MKLAHFRLLVLLLGLSLAACQKTTLPSTIPVSLQVKGQLAFCGKENESDRYDIYLIDLATREWLNLTEKYIFQIDDAFGHSIGCDDDMRPYRVTGVAWSPLGNLLMVDAGGPYLNVPYIINVSEKGDVLKIVQQWPRPWPNLNKFESPQEYSWSPDGDKVAFSGITASDGYRNLFVGDVSDWIQSNPNTKVVQMTEEYRDWPGVIYYPIWSPNGKSIAVSFNGNASGIAVLNADGTQLIYVNDDTTAQLSYVQNPTSPWIDSMPSWFPDSESVVFVAATTPNDRTALFKVNRDGKNLTLLIPKGVRNPVVSPGGQYIAYIEYAAMYELGTIGRIVRVDADGKNRQVLVNIGAGNVGSIWENYYIRDLSWSPDGKWLIFASNKSGKFQLYVVSTDGSMFWQLMEFPGDAVCPQWRPIDLP